MIEILRENPRPIREIAARVACDRPPTHREIEIFLVVVEQSDLRRAARILGISRETVSYSLSVLYERIGAENRTHAAVLLWPLLGDRYRLPLDRAEKTA